MAFGTVGIVGAAFGVLFLFIVKEPVLRGTKSKLKNEKKQPESDTLPIDEE